MEYKHNDQAPLPYAWVSSLSPWALLIFPLPKLCKSSKYSHTSPGHLLSLLKFSVDTSWNNKKKYLKWHANMRILLFDLPKFVRLNLEVIYLRFFLKNDDVSMDRLNGEYMLVGNHFLTFSSYRVHFNLFQFLLNFDVVL